MTKRELADAILNARHMPEREALAAFALDPVTAFASNPFARTSAAAVKHTWTVQAFEFPARDIQAIGLSSLLQAVSALPGTELLMQEILRTGPHTLNAFYHGERREIVGAVLYGHARRLVGPFWTPILGPFWTPIDSRLPLAWKAAFRGASCGASPSPGQRDRTCLAAHA